MVIKYEWCCNNDFWGCITSWVSTVVYSGNTMQTMSTVELHLTTQLLGSGAPWGFEGAHMKIGAGERGSWASP